MNSGNVSKSATLHLHLDPLGGIAGDMFTAALLSAFPEYARDVTEVAEAVAGVPCRFVGHQDGVLTGSQFLVSEPETHYHHHHEHTTWRAIRNQLESAPLPAGARNHAIGIFSHLASAEGRIHGVDAESVTFHEVGSADSIADIVAAAWLIDALGASRWSVGDLPLGGGRVRTAHGLLPVPPPATALLLEGFAFHDDGILGERVTPTGAAILRYLGCEHRTGMTGRLLATGHGFGTRKLPGVSNVLRLLAFDTAPTVGASTGSHRDLIVIGFEVDDQSGEDLAAGLDRLRVLPGVHDVLQLPVFGKKSRVAIHVQVLAAPDQLDNIVEGCFRETSTIGLRTHLVQGRALARTMRNVDVGGVSLRVKSVDRPGGVTAKADSDDALHLADYATRQRLRRRAEQVVTESNHE